MSNIIEIIPHLKIVLLGNSGVGKTSIMQQFRNQNFNSNTHPTVGT